MNDTGRGDTIAEGEIFGRSGVDTIAYISVEVTDLSSLVPSDLGYKFSGGVNITASSISVTDVTTSQSVSGVVVSSGRYGTGIHANGRDARERSVQGSGDDVRPSGNQKTASSTFVYDQTRRVLRSARTAAVL